MKKYELTEESIIISDRKLYRIRSLFSFGEGEFKVESGELGGFIEKVDNLDQEGVSWVHDKAQVFGNAEVFGDAQVHCFARVYDNAKVFGTAMVGGYVQLYGSAQVFDDACVDGYAQIYGNAQVYDEAFVSGYAKVYDNARVYDNACVDGYAQVYNSGKVLGQSLIRGHEQVHGDMCVNWISGTIKAYNPGGFDGIYNVFVEIKGKIYVFDCYGKGSLETPVPNYVLLSAVAKYMALDCEIPVEAASEDELIKKCFELAHEDFKNR